MIYESDLVEALHLDIVLPSDTGELPIEDSDICRPGLQLTGYWDYFAWERPQLFGKVEMAYLDTLDEETLGIRLNTFFSFSLPCVVVCRNLPIPPQMLECAKRRHVPIYKTAVNTVKIEMDMINYLNNALAPSKTLHGVLVDVYGVGLLITGNSGIGKSESALELVKRGHRLVADDVVIVKRVNENRLVGYSPSQLRHLMEIRGIGIIDVYTMYGVASVIPSKSIDLVVHMELWKEGHPYDRLGLDSQTTPILDVNVPYMLLPIHPGRNIAIVLEVAARNLRLKQMGYNAAEELIKRNKNTDI